MHAPIRCSVHATAPSFTRVHLPTNAARKRDGALLSVGPHGSSNIGAKPCGAGTARRSREARELASVECAVNDERLFHFELTPDFGATRDPARPARNQARSARFSVE
jgi:hypothetical protein